MTKSADSFYKGFQEFSQEDWQSVLAGSLKNVSLEKGLLKDTYEGIKLKGLYHPQNTQETSSGFPGAYPFVRGSKTSGNKADGWVIAQSYFHPDTKFVNQQIREDILGGVKYFNLYFDRKGRKGIYLFDEKNFRELFEGIDIDSFEWGVNSHENILLTSTYFLHILKVTSKISDKLNINFNNDPYQIWVKNGELPFEIDRSLSHMVESARLIDKYLPQSRSIGVSSSCYHNAGANAIQEIAYMLATAVDYVEAMKKGGFEPIKAFSKIHFSFSFDSQLFYNQAKVRAFRFLLSRVIEAYGGDREQQKPKIYGRTSLRMLSKYDAWTNIMRITTATLGACLSDIDSIESFDHNRILVEELESEESQTLSRRIARNCSHILSDESFMGQVMDPAGGSYFIENLTNEYAMKAWEIFQKIEQDGGMGECLNKGIIQEQVKEITKMRKENIHLRKENVIGVSKFALSSQALLENWKPKEKSSFHLHEKDCEAKLTKKIVKKSREYVAYDYKDETLGEILMDSYVEGFTLEKASQILHSQAQKDKIEPLEKYRTAHDFEKLRFFIEQENLKSQWKIRYIVCGDLKKLNPQLLFAKDIFDSLGIESEEVFTNDVSEIEANDCHINVYICDQELLDESGAAVMKLLKKKRNLIYTTKKLKEAQLEELKAAGLEESLYSGMNVYQTLHHVVKELGGYDEPT